MTVTIVTALYGRYDVPRAQVEQDVDTQWLLYTDDRDLRPPAPWQVVIERAWHPDPRRAAKHRKMCPPHLTDDVIWVDANMQVTARTFAREALASRHDGIALFRHPRRDDIYDEAAASVGAESQGGKYDGEPIWEQVEHYRAEGHPPHSGLWAGGTIAWHLPEAASIGHAWQSEVERWSTQDQLSLPVVLRRAGVRPGVFPVRQIEGRGPGFLHNRWLRIHGHHPVPVA